MSISIGRALVVGALALSVVAGARWRTALPSIAAASTAVVPLRTDDARITGDSLDAAESMIADNDVFRLSNISPTVRYSAAPEPGVAGSAYTPAPAPRPTLILKAIVGGPPWRALIDGIPGQPAGTLAEPGSRFDKLVVRTVTSESVTIQGADTSWVLTFSKR